MAWRIPDDVINDLRDRVSIVDVVSNYVSLKRSGRNWLGLCPFHSEKSPSFTVNEERGLFHCFGCGAGGSVFTFLMQQERLEFREAIEMVAQRAGVELPRQEVDERAANERERLLRLNGWAAKHFTESLWSREGEGARRYLEERGVSEEISRRFGLGYAPAAGDFIAGRLAARPEAVAAAARLGLVSQRDGGGGAYDRFRSRIMFPIRDPRGSVVAFGGRALGDVQPKYLNSPESPLFHKSDVLYALPEARDGIRKGDEAILVEGYLDALALIQFGIGNAVATLGTALTGAHLRLVRRLAKRIVMFFDGDAAGRRAAARAFAVCAEAGVWADGAFLPDGEDPDSFVRRHGAAAVRELLSRAVPLADFYFEQLQEQAKAGMQERAQAAQEAMRVVGTVKDPIERDLLLRAAAGRLGVGEEALRAAVRRAPARTTPQQARGGAAPPAAGFATARTPLEPRAELLLLETMAVDEGIARALGKHGVIERFTNPELADCARKLAAAWEHGGDLVGAIEAMPVAVAARLSGTLIAHPGVDPEERHKLAEDCVRRIEADAEEPHHEAARREVYDAAAAGDEEREREGLRRIQSKLRQRKGANSGESR